MCSYRKEDKCTVNNEKCPWVYWCDKVNTWKELSKTPKKCKVAENVEIPNGCNKVLFGRRQHLYVLVGDQAIRFVNPFDYIPRYVELYETEDGLKIKV